MFSVYRTCVIIEKSLFHVFCRWWKPGPHVEHDNIGNMVINDILYDIGTQQLKKRYMESGQGKGLIKTHYYIMAAYLTF
jgi:hypothetical protein